MAVVQDFFVVVVVVAIVVAVVVVGREVDRRDLRGAAGRSRRRRAIAGASARGHAKAESSSHEYSKDGVPSHRVRRFLACSRVVCKQSETFAHVASGRFAGIGLTMLSRPGGITGRDLPTRRLRACMAGAPTFITLGPTGTCHENVAALSGVPGPKGRTSSLFPVSTRASGESMTSRTRFSCSAAPIPTCT